MTVGIREAMEDIEIGFRQLEFTIKLLSYCELDNIKPADFDTGHLVMLEGGSLRFQSGNFSTADDINRAASVAVLLAFSGTVLMSLRSCGLLAEVPRPALTGATARYTT